MFSIILNTKLNDNTIKHQEFCFSKFEQLNQFVKDFTVLFEKDNLMTVTIHSNFYNDIEKVKQIKFNIYKIEVYSHCYRLYFFVNHDFTEIEKVCNYFLNYIKN